ncbi:MAG: hypothetical protein HGA98_06430, partial [Deltaproteobacteria bacterium]|nr:hypothetical protein [Deltaproteobacteria bacterium]
MALPGAPVQREPGSAPPVLKVVLKADTRGTLEAVERALLREAEGGPAVEVIERGVGDVSKNDLAMALTGSRLVLGFDVGVLPRMEEYAREHGVEVRLHDLVDRLARDAAETARALVPPPAEEKIVGQARVVALFKSTRRGMILGCEVLEGRLAVGVPFRVIDPAGPVYQGRVESLHVEESAVRQAKPGQKVGVKISDFKQGRVGDLLECYETARAPARP